MLSQLSWQWTPNKGAAVSEMYNLHHKTHSEPNQKLSICQAAIKRMNFYTEQARTHLPAVGLQLQ